MQRIASILILLVCLAALPAAPAAAWLFDDTLVSIDGNNYTVDDFKHWWKFWQEDDQPLPKTPDPYIDWLLLSQEGARMDLANDPAFKHQTEVFLQARTLLLLKRDAVNSKIKVTDADVKARYEERYLPRWQVQRLQFKNEEAAMAAWQELADGTLTVENLITRNQDQGGPVKTDEIQLRANGIDPGWAAIFQKLSVGEVADPQAYGKGRVLYHLKEQKGGDDEDLAKLSEGIRKDLWKEQEDALTRKMLAELREKYQVTIDEERLAALDINAAEETFTDAPIITSSMQTISEKQFMVVIKRLMRNRPEAGHAAADSDKATQLKKDTATNIISQSVTNWESLDRHYEEKEPFKWSYEFNYNHRLVLSLERRLFAPEEETSDDEIRQYYEKNIGRYTQPTMVTLFILDETQAPIDQIWAELAVGKRFEQVMKESFKHPVNPQEAPANHLDPEVKAVVEKLGVGETSQIFKAQGVRVMVHLVERTLESPLPLEQVKESVRKQLRKEKILQARDEYVETLRSRSRIDIHQRQWKSIQKELGGA